MKRTLDIPRILGADSTVRLITWVDASYAVHDDMRSHTGGCMSFGTGALMPMLAKQKLNTKSTTESEIVGGSDYLPNVIWSTFFLEHQGIILESSDFNQDNKSGMKLIMNGKRSCGPGSRHINIRYFFMKNRVDTEGINVVYYPTEEMLVDFYTKPLQGSLFRLFRDVIMGLRHTDDLKIPLNLTNQERVENNVTLESNTSKAVSRLNDSSCDLPNITVGSKTAHSTRTNVQGQQGGKIDDVPICNTLRMKTYADVVRSQGKLKKVRMRSPDGNL